MQEAEVGGSATEVMIKGAFFIHDDNVENFQMEVFLGWVGNFGLKNVF